MKKIFLLFLLLILPFDAFAEKILLKSGQLIEARIIEVKDEYIRVQYLGAVIPIFFDRIKSIDGEEIGFKKEESSLSVRDDKLDKDYVLAKIKNAERKIKRIKGTLNRTVDYKSFLTFESEQEFDMDFSKKILYSKQSIKDFNLLFCDTEEAESKGDQDQKEGSAVPDTKDKDSRKELKKEYKKLFDSLIQKMKSFQPEVYMTDEYQYFNIEGKWIKLYIPELSSFWDTLAKIKDTESSVGDIMGFLSSSGCAEDEFVANMLDELDIEKDGDINKIIRLSESDYFGKPCFMLELRNEKFIDFLKKMITSQTKMYGLKDDFNTSVEDFSSKAFISKETYLSMGSETQLSIRIAFEETADMEIDFKDDTSFSYPDSALELPAALEGAIEIKNEEELKDMLTDFLGEKFKKDFEKTFENCDINGQEVL